MNEIIIIWKRQTLCSRDHLHRARSKRKMKFQDVYVEGCTSKVSNATCSHYLRALQSLSLSLSLFLPPSIHVLLLQRRLVTEDNAILLLSDRFRGCTVVIHGTMPIQSLYRHENVPIEQWPPTLCYRASDRKEFDVTKNSIGQWSSFLKSEGGD